MIIGIPKETRDLEHRVALSPESVGKLVKRGCEIILEKNAGLASGFIDSMYADAGATVVDKVDDVFAKAELIAMVQSPTDDQIKKLKKGQTLVAFLWALQNKDLVGKLKDAGVTSLAMEAVPRITRAQKMDALSSMSSIAGYKAVLLAANHLGKYFPMLMTAAGTIPPSKVLILGAGVAGLQAIATARRLGAVVEAFDVRPAVKEQVQSLGATFIDIPLKPEDAETKGGYAKEQSEENKQITRDTLHSHVKKSDIVITTALVPGKKAPVLITKDMVEDMAPGSVIIDLAAEQGGNCELTQAGKVVNHKEVLIDGPLNVPSSMAYHASLLYSRNMLALLDHLLTKENALHFDFEDEITQYSTITHAGEFVSPALKNGL
ncbi:Re/Si-specific NAD(P)(+) transhydrogenase subunit alpha [bacterium]|nr:MAG: Re/Si-specific NAD(P)(+) transhydrogenase subunit alpha [bacterium]